MRCVRAGLALSVLPILGCPAALPGDEVGTYRVQMSLAQNTCGPTAVHLMDGHRYTAQLRSDGDRGYWRISGQTPLEGQYEGGTFRFRYESVVARSAPDAGTFCQLLQTEELSGAVALTAPDAGLDAGSAIESPSDAGALPAQGLVGAHTFTISAVPGTDCSEAFPPAGPFLQLPCVVSYSLLGTPTESF